MNGIKLNEVLNPIVKGLCNKVEQIKININESDNNIIAILISSPSVTH